MLGYRIHEWGASPVWGEIPDPSPGPGEVLVEVEACGVGRTVLNCINGNLNDGRATLPRVPGHELVGTVSAAGDDRGAHLVGRRVAAYFYLVCQSCRFCANGQEPRCENLAGWVGVHRDGGYAPAVALPIANVVEMPEGLDPVAATVVPDALATPVHVADRAAIDGNDRVVVIGAGGGVGSHMVQVAGLHTDHVAGFDVGDHKLAAIAHYGAIAVDSSDFDGVAAGDIFDDGPPTVVVDFIGTDASTQWSLSALGMGGRLVCVTTFPNRPQTFEARSLVFTESSIIGSRYSNRAQVQEAARLVAEGRVSPVIGRVGAPDDVPDMHASLLDGSLIGRGALDWRMA